MQVQLADQLLLVYVQGLCHSDKLSLFPRALIDNVAHLLVEIFAGCSHRFCDATVCVQGQSNCDHKQIIIESLQ